MSVCSFCSLLCEYEPNRRSPRVASDPSAIEPSQCPLRVHSIKTLAKAKERLDQASNGSHVVDRLLAQANVWIKNASRIFIAGTVVSVDTARSVIEFAKRVNAFVDVDGSHVAYRQIRAVQRSGMMTASLSEVRFRSDLTLLIGDDHVLDEFPRLPERMFETSPDNSNHRHIACLGDWSDASLARFQQPNAEVLPLPIAVSEIPRFLFRLGSSTDSESDQSSRTLRSWLQESQYSSVVWSNSSLDEKQSDLWVERLFQWIVLQNESKRCVGFPLGADYGTFQQVCTWLIGFPGRIQFGEDEIQYRPNYANQMNDSFDLEIRVDERNRKVRDENSSEDIHRLATKRIFIGSNLIDGDEHRLMLPSQVAGYDFSADFFRVDASVVLRAGPEHANSSATWPRASEWLNRLGSRAVC